jgi:4-hydroxy-3-methylbut-2-enyl diphosphate reductase
MLKKFWLVTLCHKVSSCQRDQLHTMRIILAEHFGICFGVRDAIAQAEDLVQHSPLTILGELVHNPIVRERLRAQGVAEGSLDDIPSIGMLPRDDRLEADATSARVMITAHGASDAKRTMWREQGFDVVDGTCPLVRHAHEQLKRLVAAGYFPVVIGKLGHVEVRGLTEDFPEARVVDLSSDILKLPRRDRYGVISQTTQPIARVRALVAELERLHPASEVRFVDTVCKPTKDRQSALRKLIDVAEVIVVVGGRESNNTRQLVETCRAAGRRAFHIERPEELRSEWFDSIDVVGLTAGTSTLRETVETVFRRLEEIARTQP